LQKVYKLLWFLEESLNIIKAFLTVSRNSFWLQGPIVEEVENPLAVDEVLLRFLHSTAANKLHVCMFKPSVVPLEVSMSCT
jgi:hypothetical protein